MHTLLSTNKTGGKRATSVFLTSYISKPLVLKGTITSRQAKLPLRCLGLGQDLCLSTTAIDSHDTCAEECSARQYVVIPSKATPSRCSLPLPYDNQKASRNLRTSRVKPNQPLPLLLSGISLQDFIPTLLDFTNSLECSS